jgi:hypothetical protein
MLTTTTPNQCPEYRHQLERWGKQGNLGGTTKPPRQPPTTTGEKVALNKLVLGNRAFGKTGTAHTYTEAAGQGAVRPPYYQPALADQGFGTLSLDGDPKSPALI